MNTPKTRTPKEKLNVVTKQLNQVENEMDSGNEANLDHSASSSYSVSPKRNRKKNVQLQEKENKPISTYHLRKRIEKSMKISDEHISSYEDDTSSEDSYGESATSESDGTDKSEDFDTETSNLKTLPCKIRYKIDPSITEKTNKKKHEYVIRTEEYFSNNASKMKTSNHTLSQLNIPRLSQEQLQRLLAKICNDNHEEIFHRFAQNSEVNFSKWLCLLHNNFNILLYGLGSKTTILKQFHKLILRDLPVVIINGFFPNITLKDILDGILQDILDIKDYTSNVFDACELILNQFVQVPDQHLYIIIHNIEGNMLRNNKSQSVLAKLSCVPNIHLITSIDHVNAPLIWDHNILSKFNFIWWDITSFVPYSTETVFETSMIVQRSETLALSSLQNIFLSLTCNSKGIYMIILKYQLENNVNQYYQGFLFKALYWACREAFLVSSDLALRAQLTEFIDHKIIKMRRSADGAEYLLIPIANTLLQQFSNQQTK